MIQEDDKDSYQCEKNKRQILCLLFFLFIVKIYNILIYNLYN